MKKERYLFPLAFLLQSDESKVIDGLQYRLWVREGTTQVSVIDWQDINRAFLKNYFILDTSWMIPNKYFIDIKLTSNQEVNNLH